MDNIEIVDSIQEVPLFKNENFVRFISYAVGLALVLFALSGCSPQQKLQRLENRDPELFKPITKDSISKPIIKYTQHDTVIAIPKESDTTSFIGGLRSLMIHDTIITQKFIHGSTIIEIRHDTITAICDYSAYKDTVRYKNETIDSLITVTKEGLVQDIQYETHWYDIAARSIAGIALLLLIILAIIWGVKSKL